MIRTIVRILGAACSALLLYFSYDLQFGVMLAIAAIFVLIAAIAQAKMLLQCILLCIFYSIFVCAQWLFIISSVANGDAIPAMMLVPLAVLLIHLIPVCLCIVLFKRNRVESMLVGMLLAEFLFVQFNLGNQFFQIGTILAPIPSLIQCFNVTGIWGGSFLIVFTGYCLYRMVHCWKWAIPLLFVFSSVICINMLSKYATGQQEWTTNVSVVSLGMENNRIETASSMLNDSIVRSCKFILWPEGAVVKRESAYMFDPLLTQFMRMAKRYGTVSYFGLNTVKDTLPTNSIVIVRKTGVLRRFKEHLIPFSEYIPYRSILGNISVIRNNILYPLVKGQTSYSMAENENICPLICYESLSTDFLCQQVKKGAQLFFVSSSNEYINNRHIEEVTKRILQSNAVILNREIVRAVTNGLSMHVDNRGNILELPYSSTNVTIVSVGLHSRYMFYAKHKTVVDAIYIILLLLLLFFANNWQNEPIHKKV